MPWLRVYLEFLDDKRKYQNQASCNNKLWKSRRPRLEIPGVWFRECKRTRECVTSLIYDTEDMGSGFQTSRNYTSAASFSPDPASGTYIIGIKENLSAGMIDRDTLRNLFTRIPMGWST